MRPHFSSKTILYHSSSKLSKYLISTCPSFRTGYKPTFWLFNGFFHLLFEATFGDMKQRDFLCKQVSYKREIIQHPDGGTLAIDWAGKSVKKTKKVVLIGPGITGDSSAQYIRHLSLEAIRKGFSVGVLIGRGISGLPITTDKVHSAGAYDDFGYLIKKIKNRYTGVFAAGVGTSMGSGIMLKYASETGENCLLDAVAGVATSFNHNVSARAVDEVWPYLRIPGIALRKIAQDALRMNSIHLKKWDNELVKRGVFLENGLRVKTFFDFDDQITSKICGYSGAQEYYEANSTHTEIDKIKIPLFALSSLDDPIITPKGIPFEAFKASDNAILMATTNGGHVGWFTGNIKLTRWYPVPCIEFFEAIYQKSRFS